MNIRYLVAASALSIALPTGYAFSQDRNQEERPITLVGCVMTETEYRDTYGPGLSGPRGPGIGGRNEYMLVDAREVTPGSPEAGAPPETDAAPNTGTSPNPNTVETSRGCPATPGTFPTAYELTGSNEKEISEFVGRRVVLTGIQKEANVRPVGTSGTLRPTGGFDPLGHEMHLFEVEVDTFREFREMRPALAEAPAPAAPAPAPQPEREVAVEAAPAAAPAPAPAPAVEMPAAEPAPQVEAAPAPEAPVEQAPQMAQLPRTASPLPLAGLIGLVSLAAAAGIRAVRRRRQTRSY